MVIVDLVIVGGGLSGGLAALALAERRPEISFILLEQEQGFGGNHVWSFFDTDVEAADRWLVEPLVAQRWADHQVIFPKRRRHLSIGYNSITSERLDAALRQRLKPEQYRVGAGATEVGVDRVLLDKGEKIEARAVIDARGVREAPRLNLAWQKFVGRTFRLPHPHSCATPIIMDATVAQEDGYRFVYTLPFSDTQLMVEDTYYSDARELDVEQLRGRIDQYLARKGWGGAELVAEETGVLPVLLGGRVEALWDAGAPSVALLGMRGGFFHPTTGYSLPDAVRNAVLLAEQRDLGSKALHALFRDRAASLWRERRFYQLLNRMLFRAAAPEERYRVLEHFYRLPEPVIARFYAARLTALDKLRIVSGRPPVPLGRALSSLKEAS